jgi:3-oxoacyl-[acyl-carrier-protein] synthase-3
MKRPIAYVAGTGRGIPAKVMTNHDFAALGLETSHEWIVERTGIVERRIAAADETTCSMAVTAARQAMAKAGVHAGELDAIVLSTATPDRLLPATAVELQAQLGATRAAAFDLSAACTGWLYSMTVAEGLIQSGVIETALVVGAEKMSAIVDWKDRSTCVLFGDGAGAVVLKRSSERLPTRGISAPSCGATCTLAREPLAPCGRAAVPFSDAVLRTPSYVTDGGRDGVQARRATDERGLRPRARRREAHGHDIDVLIPAPGQQPLIEATRSLPMLPMEEGVPLNVDRSATPPRRRSRSRSTKRSSHGRHQAGEAALLCAFGAGSPGARWSFASERHAERRTALSRSGLTAPGMGKDLAARFPAAREVFEAADVALGVPLSTLCFEGPAEELTLTHNAQPRCSRTAPPRGPSCARHLGPWSSRRRPLARRVHGVPCARTRCRSPRRSASCAARGADARGGQERPGPWRRCSARSPRPIEEICQDASDERASSCRRTTTARARS